MRTNIEYTGTVLTGLPAATVSVSYSLCPLSLPLGCLAGPGLSTGCGYFLRVCCVCGSQGLLSHLDEDAPPWTVYQIVLNHSNWVSLFAERPAEGWSCWKKPCCSGLLSAKSVAKHRALIFSDKHLCWEEIVQQNPTFCVFPMLTWPYCTSVFKYQEPGTVLSIEKRRITNYGWLRPSKTFKIWLKERAT